MKGTVAVIGGGVVGASTAHHLSEMTDLDVTLFEAENIGCASTARSVGGIRSVFRHRLEVQLSQYSLRELCRLASAAQTHPFRFHRDGYALFATSEGRRSTLQQAGEIATELDVPVETLDRVEAAEKFPGLCLDGIVHVAYSPGDGYVDSTAAVARTYAESAVGNGATIHDGTPITFVEQGEYGFGISSPGQFWEVDQVVIANNAFSQTLLGQLGVDLACYPYPRHVFSVRNRGGTLSRRGLNAVFQDEDLLLRSAGDKVLAIAGFPEASSLSYGFDPGRLEEVRGRIGHRVGWSEPEVSYSWSGLRSVTPDRRAAVGAVPGVPGAWCAVGFSGHGFMHAPGIGRAMAEEIGGVAHPMFDLGELDPARLVTSESARPPVLETGHS